MLKAGALFYAIAVSLVIAILSGALIFYSYLNSILFEQNVVLHKLQLNAQSGLNILLATESTIGLDEKRNISLFDGDIDSVQLERKSWGGFEICSSKSFFKNDWFSKVAFTGCDFFEDNQTALYLSDLNKPLALCGKTVIKGTCFLPEAGVQRAYIEGQNFIGDKLIDGAIKLSKPQLPPINNTLLTKIQSLMVNPINENDSVINAEEQSLPDTIINSFINKTIVVYDSGNLEIEHQKFEGNIIVYSKRQIMIKSSAKLKDVLIIASGIVVEDTFSGSFQSFATDSIVIGKGCRLNYPTVLALAGASGFSTNSFITINETAVVAGVVCILAGNSVSELYPSFTLAQNAELYGQLFSNGSVDLKGSVFGSVFCNKILLKTLSSVYENHLLNATIDFSKLSPHFVGIGLVEQSKHKKIVKWLN